MPVAEAVATKRRAAGPMRGAAIGGIALLLSGCITTVGPDYTPPTPRLPTAYAAAVPALFEEPGPLDQWWRLFADDVLDDLVRRGAAANLDIRVAASRVREARALARAADSRQGPTVALGGRGDGETRLDRSSVRRGTEASTSISAFLDFSYDLDLFGGIKRSREAAWAEAERQEALAREAVRIAVGEIARTYVDLRAAERRLALTEQSLALQRQTGGVVDARVASGLAPGLDQVRAQAAVAVLEADLGPLRASIARLRNALAVLLAEPPGALDQVLAEHRPIPRAGMGAAIGLPLDLIRRRPDIQAAELLIAATTAEVGVATAELYPRLTLPGRLTAGVFDIGTGTIVSSVIAGLSALFNLPIFDGGERSANVSAAEQRVIQATLTYRDTLLRALQEVEAALVNYEGARTRRAALVVAVEKNRLAYDQSQELYRQGFVTFIDVLDSQRQWNASLQDLADAVRAVGTETVNLFSAVGGSSPGAAIPAADPPPRFAAPRAVPPPRT